jgi:predicted TIM-barrel fold metal-dependent hydrolase
MGQTHEEFHKLKFKSAVDADGHILEAPDTWERHLEKKYQSRALRLKKDQNGLEYLEIDGKQSKLVRDGMPGSLGGMGQTVEQSMPGPQRTYASSAPFGAMDAKERIQRIDAEGLAAAFLYPTLSLLYEVECTDADLAQAYTRAYNRWIVEFCAGSGGRLIPIAHLSLGDPQAAAAELERAVKDGCKGGWVAQFTMTRKPHAHPDHDVLFAKAQELDVPLAIHPTFEPLWAMPGRYDYQYLRGKFYFLNVIAADAVRYAFTSFFQFGVFDKFPKFKLVLLEAGAGWISYWLDHLDAVYESFIGRSVPLKEKPSFYFNRQCWISGDPDEHSLPAMIELLGAEKFFWASDFPHPDHVGNYIEEVEELGEKLKPQHRDGVLGENVMRVYNCQMPAAA